MLRMLLAAVGLIAILAGCGRAIPGTPDAGTSAADAVPGVVGFLYESSTAVVFLQWPSNPSGWVNGTAKSDGVTGQPPQEQTTDQTNSFSGQISVDGSVAFDFPGQASVYGAQSGNTLTLNLPAQGGGLQSTKFLAATPDDYNKALASLRDMVDQANGTAQQQQQINQDARSLGDAVAALSNDSQGLTGDLSGLSNTVTGADRDSAATSTAASASIRSDEAAQGCGDVASAGGDASGVGGDASSVGGDLQTLSNDLAIVRQQMGTVTSDLSQVQHEEPGYVGSAYSSSPADVQTAINDANTAIARVVNAANSDIDKTNADVAGAYAAIANAARRTGCQVALGGPAPAPIRHIS